MPVKPTPAFDRAMRHVVKQPGGCWIWTGYLNHRGYGTLGGPLVHRIVYEHLVGPIPDGLTIDHLCTVKTCCNPDHLEPVTRSENTKRQWARGDADPGRWNREKTHCLRGHPFDEENTYHSPSSGRHCRACNVIRMREYKKRKVAA